MNHARERRKRTELKIHRFTQYDKAMDGLFAGTIPPEYAHERWQKLKPLLR